jgi:glycosyltransferase involved in cell wall biosynthesis
MSQSNFQSMPEDGIAPSTEAALEAAGTRGRLGRVLFVTSNFPRWANDSTTPFILHLAQDLQALGWRVDVLAPHAPGVKPRELLEGVLVERFRYLWPESLQTLCYEGGALINLRKKRAKLLQVPPFVLSEWLAVHRRLARGSYDLLHSHWILPQGFTGTLAAKALRIPHVTTVHGGDVFALRGRILSRFKRFALAGADVVTVNSSATEAAAVEFAPGLANIRRIPIGISDRRSQLSGNLRQQFRRGGGPCLVFVGRVIEEKGVGDLIRAVSLLGPSLPDATAVIVGEGQDRLAMQTRARELGVADRVTFTGWVAPRDVPDILAAGDVFVGASRTAPDGWIEGQGLTMLEAMLAGLPVIATRSGGIVDAVQHEETGLLVNEASPEDIADAVLRLSQDSDLACHLAENGTQLVRRKFTRDASANAFSDLYLQLAGSSGH